jgi:23S rRNA-/tRNA-specific pseudouridylate synthase
VIPDRRGSASLRDIAAELLGGRVWTVHRIDRETSGLVLVALDAESHRRACGLFEARLVRKDYIALLRGTPEPAEGDVELPLRVFGSGRTGVDPGGKPSSTRYSVLEERAGFSLALVIPLTGRQHQIRAHMFAAGHPVAGDTRYGREGLEGGFKRMMLHAWRLHLPGELLECPPPDSFTGELERLGFTPARPLRRGAGPAGTGG